MRLSAWIATAALVMSAVPAADARQKSPQNASYTLAATLDPAARTIAGRGRLTWRNITASPTSELQFHMYWNAWRDTSSTWLKEQALITGSTGWTEERRGSIDLTRLSLVTGAGPRDLLPRVRWIAPDDGNERDRTVFTVALDAPVAPGGVVDVDFEWTARVPWPFARTGVADRFFLIGHWFPKVGVLGASGWITRQFHAPTEFFSDYGAYDVSLTVPSGWIVGATGREQSKTDNPGGTTTRRYVQTDVHDFAWMTSPDVVELIRRVDVPGTSGIDVRLILPDEQRTQADRQFDAAARALTGFSAWFGPYPHAQLTIVSPPSLADPDAQGSFDGMEYPTFITTGTRWLMPWRYLDPEDVTIHEVGHQFFQGAVGSNEFDDAWLDEGVTTYITGRLMAESYPGRFAVVERYFGGLVPWTYADVPWSRDLDSNYAFRYRLAPGWDAPSTPSWKYGPRSLGPVTYAKPALWLTSLERLFGWDMVRTTLGAFYTRSAFHHPVPDDLFNIASSVANRDLTWFFDAVHRSAATFDYAVEDVVAGDATGDTIESTVIVRRLREGVFPIEVRTTFDDGQSVSERWSGQEPWRAFTYRRPSAVRTVEVDPARILTLDLNYTNNSWTAAPRAAETSRYWALRWMTWLQTVLVTYAFFA